MSNVRSFKRKVAQEMEEQRRIAAEQVWEEFWDRIDPGIPMDKDSSLWMCWLYPSEWRFLFATAAALQEAGLIPRAQASLQRIWIDAIGYLQRECGYQFQGLKLSDDDELYVKQKEPLAQVNIYWIRMLHFMTENPDLQISPDVLQHARFAIEFAEEKVPGLNIEILRDYERLQSGNVEEARKRKDDIPLEAKERLREIERLRRQFYEQHPEMERMDFEL